MLDDKFHGHKKTLALFDGPCAADAIALWTLANSWCGDQLTDGKVPLAFVRRSGLDKKASDELVRVGLWHKLEDGFQFHNWLERNKSRAQVEKERQAARDRKENGKASDAGKTTGVRKKFARTSDEPNANGHGTSPEVQPEFAKGSSAPDPNSDPSDQDAAAASDSNQKVRAKMLAKLAETHTVSPEDVYREWHAVAPPGTLHQLHGWLADYGTIADTLNGHPKIRPANRKRVLAKLCLWVWRDPEGPHAAGRLTRITPDKIAKRCSDDIDSAVASDWVAERVPAPVAEATA